MWSLNTRSFIWWQEILPIELTKNLKPTRNYVLNNIKIKIKFLYQGIQVRDIIKELCTKEFKKGKENFLLVIFSIEPSRGQNSNPPLLNMNVVCVCVLCSKEYKWK